MLSHKTKPRPHPPEGPAHRPPGVAPEAPLARAVTVPLSVPEPHEHSLTALAVQALRREELEMGSPRGRDALHRDGRDIRGDPDRSIREDECVGDRLLGESTPTPDENLVDDVGRAYGIQEEDSGVLRSSFEILDRRDHHRSELMAPR
jgi:hypothetical protein